jgi:VWFA-related protein
MGASASARQTGRSTQVFGAGVDLVQVDVSVLDKNRRPVRDLQASDFTLLEDGRPRPVAAFVSVDLPSRAETPRAAWMRAVPFDVATNDVSDEGRLVVIVMDRTIPFGLPAQSARSVARAAIEQLAPGDLAAVVYTGSSAPQDFTNDRARLLAAIGDNAAAGLSRDVAERWEAAKDQLETAIWNYESAGRAPRLLPLDNSGECYCGVCVLEAIETIANAVRDTRGRQKSLLFIGADITTDTQDPSCEAAVIDARTRMFKSIDLANLTVHAFDANGLESNGVAPSTPDHNLMGVVSPRPGAMSPLQARSRQLIARQGHLAVLPDHTGGRTVLNTNNPEARVPDVFRESESYYLLGFEPATTDGREHTISVKVNRRDVTVRSRRAFVADPPGAFTSSAPVDRAHDAIVGAIAEKNGITLTANALAVAAPVTHSPVLIVALHAQHDASKDAATARPEQVDVVTAVFTLDGRPVGTYTQTLQVTPTNDPGASVAYDVLQRMAAKPGSYELRLGVNNAARRQSGSVYAFVDVPALDKAGFTWGDAGISSPAVTPATNDGLDSVVPALPIARRDFDRRERVSAFLSAYHVSGPPPASIEIVSRIVDEQNRQRFEQKTSLAPTTFDTMPAAYTVDLPLTTLAPGAYLLTMEARAGNTKATRDVRFTVR